MDEKNLDYFLQQKKEVIGVKKIIAVASAKGGVGKSTIACNIAVALAKKNLNIALVDGDIYGPSIPHIMNINKAPDQKNNLILPIISHNVKCISIGSIIDINSAGIWRGPMITKILNQLIRSVNWQSDNKEVDIMIIDMPPGTGDIYLSIAEKFAINGVILISTPHSLSIIDLVRSVDCFKKLNVKILGLIQNMSYLEINNQKQYIFGNDGVKKLAQQLNLPFIGDIPICQKTSNPNNQNNLATDIYLSYQDIFLDIINSIISSG